MNAAESEGVRALAAFNAKRQGFPIRNVTIACLTVPLTLAALWVAVERGG